jgi:RimJ/RimL family protein N-acetyltransferase
MINIKTTKNYKEIANIINKPGYKEWIFDKEGAVTESDLLVSGIKYYLFDVYGIVAGFCAFRQITDDISICDVAFLEEFRGKVAKEISLEAIRKFKKESSCKILITRISKKNKRSLYFAKWLGFVKYLDDDNYIYLRLILWAEYSAEVDQIHQMQQKNI